MTRAGWDELEEEGGWVVARQGDSFTALYSHQPADWWGESELVALGRQVARSVLFCTVVYCRTCGWCMWAGLGWNIRTLQHSGQPCSTVVWRWGHDAWNPSTSLLF